MFVIVAVCTCAAVLRKQMYKCMCRPSESAKNMITTLANSAVSAVLMRPWNYFVLVICVYTLLRKGSTFG